MSFLFQRIVVVVKTFYQSLLRSLFPLKVIYSPSLLYLTLLQFLRKCLVVKTGPSASTSNRYLCRSPFLSFLFSSFQFHVSFHWFSFSYFQICHSAYFITFYSLFTSLLLDKTFILVYHKAWWVFLSSENLIIYFCWKPSSKMFFRLLPIKSIPRTTTKFSTSSRRCRLRPQLGT